MNDALTIPFSLWRESWVIPITAIIATWDIAISKIIARCSFCLANTHCAPDGTCVQCSICKGFFKSMDCYQRHLRPYSERSRVTVCDLMGRCDRCNEWMTKKLLYRHKCGGQKHCKICKRQVDEIINVTCRSSLNMQTTWKIGGSLYKCTFISISNVLRRTVFTFPIYVWLIASVVIVIISL